MIRILLWEGLKAFTRVADKKSMVGMVPQCTTVKLDTHPDWNCFFWLLKKSVNLKTIFFLQSKSFYKTMSWLVGKSWASSFIGMRSQHTLMFSPVACVVRQLTQRWHLLGRLGTTRWREMESEYSENTSNTHQSPSLTNVSLPAVFFLNVLIQRSYKRTYSTWLFDIREKWNEAMSGGERSAASCNKLLMKLSLIQ